ncbi:ABC transporter ATP-binding protein/permease [Sphingomonas sp. Leaf25]|uniref:ABC transporter ATP-binding protein/permease n=1 Tax=Sphingomonas sp. Leaf25 TaxID=1735692 RepID=UPI000ACDBC04|nr:ABC transporter ATP-binding protein/permease [Sphingomonas sp. Leaf25]
MTLPVPTGGEVRREAGAVPPQPARERWRHAFVLIGQYWGSADWKFAWGALATLIGLQFGTVYVFIATNRWQQDFFDSVEQRRVAEFAGLVLAFIGVMTLQVGVQMFTSAVRMVLAIRWRAFLTERYVDRWMGRNRFAEIERLRMIDNPDQRIAVDIAAITGMGGVDGIVPLCVGVIGSIATSISFMAILLETAEPLRLSLFGATLSIPGSTIWYALLYAFVGSVVIAKIGSPYIRATMRQQHVEADFRANLIHVRRNAAQIGSAGAVPTEREGLRRSFGEVRRNYRTVIYSVLGINVGQGIYERIGSVLPLFLMAPRYLSGGIGFGQLMGARDAFQTLAGSLSYFVHAYNAIATQIANINRLKALDDALDATRPSGIAVDVVALPAAVLATTGLSIQRLEGGAMLTVADWTVRPGERWMVQGASGSGKSTLLRAIAGLWPDGQGRIALARDQLVMIVPQRLYLPLGSLKAAICFPDPPERHTDAAIAALLDRVRLGVHAAQLDTVGIWQEALSPGEQQRIALARILLQRPTLIVLDETTSALDADNARHFYRLLRDDLPDATIIGVIHDERLRHFHTHRLAIADGHAVPAVLAGDEA